MESETDNAGVSSPSLGNLLKALDASPMVSYAIDPEFRIRYCNAAWDRFAIANEAPELTNGRALGTNLLATIHAELRPFYLEGFEQANRSGAVWECQYECSSAEVFRKFQMRVHPIAPKGWFAITNALSVERPHIGYSTDGGNSGPLLTMCCHCRWTRRTDDTTRWDFVPAHLERSVTNVSHGLCPICRAYFYPRP